MAERFELWAVGVLVATCILAAEGSANAAPTVALGGGSGIVLGESTCTLATIGYDRAGRLVGLTAGHCADPGRPVRAERTPSAGVVGTVATVDAVDDYAVIHFDRTKVAPVRQVAATVIGGLGAPARPGDVVCKSGRTSGHDCGVVWDAQPWWFRNQSCSQPGDSGGPVTIGDRLVGMNVGHLGLRMGGVTVLDVVCQRAAAPLHDPAVAVQIGALLADIDADGGVGTGFRPI